MAKVLHIIALLSCLFVGPANALPLDSLTLPPGFSISVYAKAPGAREMAIAKNGIVYVGTRVDGNVYALIPNATRTAAKKVVTIASRLNQPNGVALRNGDLYVAEISRILRFPHIAEQLQKPKFELLKISLPSKEYHGWRYISFGPDDRLYVAIGVPCNICISTNPLFGTIISMRPDGSDLSVFAKGVRNSVGFAWNPSNKKFWFTDNGRDWLGDDLPPDELNYAPQSGMDFGFPYFYSDNIQDPKYKKLQKSSKGMTIPAMKLGAHVASLGMAFYTGNNFPAEYKGHIFVAQHGSWNRSKKVGYRVMLVTLKNNKPVAIRPFITGWLQKKNVWGRPVDVKVMADGSLLISDDHAGVVYRVSYKSS